MTYENMDLDQLIVALGNNKAEAKRLSEQKTDIELAIYNIVHASLVKVGTNKVHPNLNVVRKMDTKWDQEQLRAIVASGKIPDNYFPFKREYKPDNNLLKALETIDHDVHAEIMKAAIVKEAKPSFELVE